MNLKEKYQKEIVPKLKNEFGLKSNLAVPRVEKVVVNMGIGDAVKDSSLVEKAAADLAQITGQKPQIRRAKRAVSGFGIRKGDTVGLRVTLRGARMYDFLEKLFKVVLPRLRDFRGVSNKSFDGTGNYTLGIYEHTVFPEIDLGKVEKLRGLELTIVTNAKTPVLAKRLFEELGMPFEKQD